VRDLNAPWRRVDNAAPPNQHDISNEASPWELVVRGSKKRHQQQPQRNQRQKKHGGLQQLKAEAEAEIIRPKNPNEWTEEYKQRHRQWQKLVEKRGGKCDCAWHSPDPAKMSKFQRCLFLEEPFGLEPSYGRPVDTDAGADARTQSQAWQKGSLEEAAREWQEGMAEKARSYHLTEEGLEEGRQRDLRRLKEASAKVGLDSPPKGGESDGEVKSVKSNWSNAS
jgi:hypothetical protein